MNFLAHAISVRTIPYLIPIDLLTPRIFIILATFPFRTARAALRSAGASRIKRARRVGPITRVLGRVIKYRAPPSIRGIKQC